MFLNNQHQFRWSYDNTNIIKGALQDQIKKLHLMVLKQSEPIAKGMLQHSLNSRVKVLREIEEQEANSKIL